MRRVTRNALLVILGIVVVLLALGALPGYIEMGDPYYVEATVADDDGPAITAENLSEPRFPYTFGALSAAETGAEPPRSEAYYTGPGGFKEAFTHTPFDEFEELEVRAPEAVERSATSPVGDVAYVEHGEVRYRIEIIRVPEAE